MSILRQDWTHHLEVLQFQEAIERTATFCRFEARFVRLLPKTWSQRE